MLQRLIDYFLGAQLQGNLGYDHLEGVILRSEFSNILTSSVTAKILCVM
jgi:hypothetical protein